MSKSPGKVYTSLGLLFYGLGNQISCAWFRYNDDDAVVRNE